MVTAPARPGRLGAVLVAGTALLALTLRVDQGSPWFVVVGLGTAAVWVAGARWSGPVWPGPPGGGPRRPGLAVAALIGVTAFGGFAAAAELARHLPIVSGALERVLGKADASPTATVLLVALANGAGEEVFFRGALHVAVDAHRPVLVTTLVYVAVTTATGNAALVVAAAVMGALLGWERRASGTVSVPVVTHLVWSTLMVVALPR